MHFLAQLNNRKMAWVAVGIIVVGRKVIGYGRMAASCL